MPTSVVLLVMAPPACRQVASDLDSLDGVNVLLARDCREARLGLEAHPDVSLVGDAHFFCEFLRDGVHAVIFSGMCRALL